MTRFANYTLLRPLGPSPTHRVWVAVPPTRLAAADGTEVALKVTAQPVADSAYRSAGSVLARVQRLDSPHLIAILEIGRAEGHLFFSMPLVTGGSLASPATEPGEAATVRAIVAAARGAHALHEQGLVHRGINPSNVLLTDDGAVLADPTLSHLLNPGLTMSGTGSTGAVEFAEPALLRGEEPGRASDVWSLGATLYRSLTGASIYGDVSGRSMATLIGHITAARPQIAADLPTAWARIVARCLTASRGERYPTAAALADDLAASIRSGAAT